MGLILSHFPGQHIDTGWAIIIPFYRWKTEAQSRATAQGPFMSDLIGVMCAPLRVLSLLQTVASPTPTDHCAQQVHWGPYLLL